MQTTFNKRDEARNNKRKRKVEREGEGEGDGVVCLCLEQGLGGRGRGMFSFIFSTQLVGSQRGTGVRDRHSERGRRLSK